MTTSRKLKIAACAVLLALLLASASAVACPENRVGANFDAAPFSLLADASLPLDPHRGCGTLGYDIAVGYICISRSPNLVERNARTGNPHKHTQRHQEGKSTVTADSIGIWPLEFHWDLEFGIWDFSQAMAWVDVITSFVPGAGKLITKPIGWALKGMKGGAGIVAVGAFRLAERAGGKAGGKAAGAAALKKVAGEAAEEAIEKGGEIATRSMSLNPAFQKGFASHPRLIKYLGPAGKDRAWHHIVEQTPANISKFGPERVHNVSNIVNVASGKGSLHGKVSGFFSSRAPGGGRIRDLIGTKSFEEQYEFGVRVLEKAFKQ